MTRRTGFGIAAALLLLVIAAGIGIWAVRREARLETFRQVFPVMGTIGAFTLYGDDPAAVSEAMAAARAEFDRVQKLANLYDPESELSRLNRSAATAPFACSDELWLLLDEARQAYEFSGGAFDITSKPLMDLWGFYRKRGESLPADEEIARARELVGLDRVEFDDEAHTVRFPKPGMAFDLGGIAKGYAVDLAADAIASRGFTRGIIDLGGNLKLLPQGPPGHSFYRVGIRDPRDRNAVLPEPLELRNAALSTSGDYERFVILGGVRYGHIMNPATGMPTQAEYSVTVVAPSALLADWLSTAVFLCGEPLARQAEESFPGVEVILSDPAGEVD